VNTHNVIRRELLERIANAFSLHGLGDIDEALELDAALTARPVEASVPIAGYLCDMPEEPELGIWYEDGPQEPGDDPTIFLYREQALVRQDDHLAALAAEKTAHEREISQLQAELQELKSAQMTRLIYAAPTEWARYDTTWVLEHLRETSRFNVDLIEKMLDFAQGAAAPAGQLDRVPIEAYMLSDPDSNKDLVWADTALNLEEMQKVGWNVVALVEQSSLLASIAECQRLAVDVERLKAGNGYLAGLEDGARTLHEAEEQRNIYEAERDQYRDMAGCMDLLRRDMIEAGVIGESCPPMFMTEGILKFIAQLCAGVDANQRAQANPEHTLFNEIRISTPVNEDGEDTRYIITEQQLLRIRLLELSTREGLPPKQYSCDYAGCNQPAYPGTSLCLRHHSPKALAALTEATKGNAE